MRYHAETMKAFCIQILNHAGLAEGDAFVCADCLITADLRGVHSHGITHLKDICSRIEHGTIRKETNIEIEHTAPSTIKVNANHVAGMVSAMEAMKECVKMAADTGVGIAAIKNSNTYGMGAYYPMYAAEHGMIGFAVCNTKAYVAPYGGVDPALGTNPISVAVPAGKYPNLVLDMATSQAAVNKIALAMKEGREIPDTCAVGPNGERTTDPALAYQGALLSFGGYKGYAIQLIISLMAFALAGGAMDVDIPKAWVEEDQMCNFGCLMGAIDVSKFMELEEFKHRVDLYIEYIKGGRTAPGVEEIRIPGEHAFFEMQTALKEGIEISDVVVEELRKLGEKYHVECTF